MRVTMMRMTIIITTTMKRVAKMTIKTFMILTTSTRMTTMTRVTSESFFGYLYYSAK